MVSSQSFGSSAVSLACISSMCSVQCFPGGYSLCLAFGSFFYRRFLLFFAVCSNCFSFFIVFGYAWFFVQSLFFCNLGGMFISAFDHGFLLGCFVCYFMV